MLLCHEWLNELIDIPAADQLADNLTHVGLKVDGIHGFPGIREGLVAVRLDSVEKHPESKKLTVCQAFDGQKTHTVLCGAPNARTGIMAVCALPGYTLPGGLTVAEKAIAGVTSSGMLVSEKELAVSDDHGGIIELPADVAPGTLYADWFDQYRLALEVDVLANRGDALSVIGIARDCATLYNKPLRSPFRKARGQGAEAEVKISIECPDLCERYIGKVVRGVTVAESPSWLKERIRAAGNRPINNVVDITNYILHLTGHPMHAFDLDQLAEKTIIVRRPKPGETITTLDDVTREVLPDTCLICDARRPVAAGGVMGGANSEVTAETKDLLLEVAVFDSIAIRRTARHFGMKTDSSFRFERGVNLADGLDVIELAAALLEEIAGGEAATGVIDVHPTPRTLPLLTLDPVQVNRFLGAELEPQRMKDILESLGFAVTGTNGVFSVQTPPWRHDVSQSVDLIEEIIRIHGYNNVPSTLPGKLERTAVRSEWDALGRVASFFSERGFFETQTFDYLSREEVERFHDGRGVPITMLNPLGQEFSTMRTTLLPAMLRTLHTNLTRGVKFFNFFEIGRTIRGMVHHDSPERTDVILQIEGIPHRLEEENRICLASHTAAEGEGWNRGGKSADFFAFKYHLEELFSRFGHQATFRPAGNPPVWLHPGVAAEISLGDRVLGICGQVHPDFAREMELPGATMLAEFLPLPLCGGGAAKRAGELSRFPAALFDVALLVDRSVLQADLAATIRASAGEHLTGLQLFDVYEGERIPAGKRSLAYALTFRSVERTLTDDEIRSAIDSVVTRLSEEHGAVLRDA